MKYVIGIDPGHKIGGIAILTMEKNPQLIITRAFDFNKPYPWDKTGKKPRSCGVELDALIERDSAIDYHMAIESQFLGKNVDSLIKLSRNAGAWAEAASYAQITHEYVPPIEWIVAELGRRLKRHQIAILSRQKVNALYGAMKRTEHEIAAILIGRYVAVRMAS